MYLLISLSYHHIISSYHHINISSYHHINISPGIQLFYHSYIQEHYQIMQIQAWSHFLQKKKKGDKVTRWRELEQVGCILTKSDFHRLVTCLVVRTLRGKSLMMCAFLFMDMSRINGISIWQGPHTLYLWSEVMKWGGGGGGGGGARGGGIGTGWLHFDKSDLPLKWSFEVPPPMSEHLIPPPCCLKSIRT